MLSQAINRVMLQSIRISNHLKLVTCKIVKYCQSVFNFVIPSIQIAQKSEKFVKNLNYT